MELVRGNDDVYEILIQINPLASFLFKLKKIPYFRHQINYNEKDDINKINIWDSRNYWRCTG